MKSTGLLGRIGQWLPSGSHGLSVASIDGRWLKLIRTSGRTVTAVLTHRIEGLADPDVIVWLREFCAVKGWEPGPVIIANPSHLTTARLFTLPSTDPNEIRDILDLQAEKHTPYAKEEIITDFQMIEQGPGGYSRSLLVISHQEIVHRGIRMVEGLGWALERVGFELEGLVDWFTLVRKGTKETTLVADVDQDTTTLVILHEGRPYFHRNLPIGLTQLLADDSLPGLARFLAEVQRSLEAFDGEGFELSVKEAVLTGQAERVIGLKEKLQQQLKLSVVVIDPYEPCMVADGAMIEPAAARDVSCASLVGLALAPGQIDLTPQALRLHRVLEVRAKALVQLGCQLIAGALLLSCLMVGRAYKTQREHTRLLKRYESSTAEVRQLEASLEQLTLVQDWVAGRGKLLDVLEQIAAVCPPAIRWDSVTFTNGEQVVLKGVSQELPKVYEFANALKTSPMFSQVEARRVVKRGGEEQGTDFEIVCSLGKAEDVG